MCLSSLYRKQLYKIEIQCKRGPQARLCGLAIKEAVVQFLPNPIGSLGALQDCNAVKGSSKGEEAGEGESQVTISLCVFSLSIFYFK